MIFYLLNYIKKIFNILDSLIPIGVNKTLLDIIEENVMNFDAYYEISLIKTYSEDFNNSTMFSYFFYRASQLNSKITAFYGISEENLLGQDISLDSVYFNTTEILKNGQGLSNYSKNIFSNSQFVLFIITILFVIF